MGTELPQQGQVVHVRNRRFVVLDIAQGVTTADPAQGSAWAPQHLVRLSSVEDDALGEELAVIWELEPGAAVLDHAALPAPVGFDAPTRFDAFLDAVRWGTVASANVQTLQSPFRSGITIEDYQLDPVVRAIQMPRANLLIADDVGLGKTIETGLVIQELVLRHRIRTVLIVCPSALQIQWREQMRDKFGLAFRIVDSALMRQLRRERGLQVNPWSHYPLLITSIDFLKRDRPMRLMRETLPAPGEPTYPRRFDLLVIDEVHNVAPSGSGRYATDSLRTQAIRQIAPHFEHRIFLSATPHNGYPESFTALLELLDNQRFARGVAPDRAHLQAIMVRRLKSELFDWDGRPLFPQRVLEALEVAYSDEERAVHRWLHAYSQLRQASARDQVEKAATEFVLKLLKKRLFSSPEAFARTLAKHEASLDSAQRQTRALPASSGFLLRQLEQIAETGEDGEEDLSLEDGIALATPLFAPLSAEERRLLDQLRDWAERARHRPDSRLDVLLSWLHQALKPASTWNDVRVVIFTEYRDTQNWLLTMLHAAGFGDPERIMLLYGGMDAEERERVKAAFQAAPGISPVRILLATDAASEGIDLQNHCSRLVHMEIPWNPSRLEQRNGRIDRHGQHAPEVQIYHFVGQGWQEHTPQEAGALEADLEFLFRAAQKVNTIREDLGKVGPVIASQVEEAMLGHRTRLDTQHAERDSEPIRQLLKFERRLRQQIEELHTRVQESRRLLNITPERVRAAVELGLSLAGQPPLRPVRLDDGLEAFEVPALAGSWAASTEGLAHPHTQVLRPLVFDQDALDGRDDVVLAHLNHRLVQMAVRLLRAEIWATQGNRQLFRVTARTIPNTLSDVPLVVAFARLVLLGGDQKRLHEEVVQAGGPIRNGRFSRSGLKDLSRILDAVQDTPVSAELQERFRALWPSIERPLTSALAARVDDRTESLQRQLADRAAQETQAIRTILTELSTSIQAELSQANSSYQLSFFSEAERSQRQLDLDRLHERVRQIPDEIEQEVAVIAQRYADPQPRFFPVAVMFLVPERMAR